MTRNISLILALVLSTLQAHSQVTIAPNSTMEVRGTISVNGSVNNASALTGLSSAEVVLTGSDQTFNTTTPVSVQVLSVNGGGTKILEGDWEVTSTLSLNDGIVTIGSSGKLTYSGSEQVISSGTSWVNGYFFNRGSGDRFFPIGTSDVYAPAFVRSAPAGEFGLRVVNADPAFALPQGTDTYFAGHYWESSAPLNAPVSLSLNGLESFVAEGNPIVLQSSSPGAIATSLSGSVNSGFVTSIASATEPLLGIAKTAEFNLVIHDLITPYVREGVNDKLEIENIDLTTDNKVTFIDRWGVVVAEWTNFSSQTEYDFSTLSPGNYICVVEYASPGSSNRSVAKGMVTILKAN